MLAAKFCWRTSAKILFPYPRTKKQIYSIPKGIHFHYNNTKRSLGFHGNILEVRRYFHLRCVQTHFFFLKKKILLFWTVMSGSLSTASGPILSAAYCRSLIWDGSRMGCKGPGSFLLLRIVTCHRAGCWERKCHTLTLSAPAMPWKQLAPAWGATNYFTPG